MGIRSRFHTVRGRSTSSMDPADAPAPPRMRVVMLVENNPYRQDSRVRAEAETLIDAGHAVTVIGPREPGGRGVHEVDDSGVRLYRYPAPPTIGGTVGYLVEYGYSLITMAALTAYVAVRRGFDVLHAHNPPDMLCLIAAPFKPFGKRFVFDHHDLSPEMFTERFGAGGPQVLRRVLSAFEKASFRLADHVISVNSTYRDIAVDRGAVPPDRVTVVRNGPDEARMVPLPPQPDLRKCTDLVLCYVGIMGPQDGLDHLLRAIRHVVVDHGRPDTLCYLVGKGDMVPELQRMAEELGIADHLVFTGWRNTDELPRYIAAADICIDPDPSNPYNDKCTMIKMMEYMAMAKPIVAFDLPEHRATAAGAAVYASGNDDAELARLIVELADDPVERRRMGQEGRSRIETSLAWRHQAGHLVAMYDGLAGIR